MIKICGLTQPRDCQAVAAARPDFAGFVFAPGRRQVNPTTAAHLISLLDPAIRPVGVFVDEAIDWIVSVARSLDLAAVQLHDWPQPDRIRVLRDRLGHVPIWQVLPIPVTGQTAESVRQHILAVQADCAREAATMPDAWLLDSRQGQRSGGLGQPFDWACVAHLPLNRPLFLAGGLDADNVSTAIRIVRPQLVDCSSGVETDGCKDPAKILLFCRNSRQAE
jgi:phosphoribosylanthranilate isomerase